MALTRHGGAYGTQRNGAFTGRTVTTTLRVCHETRKALEALVASVATCTVSWPNRPFTLPIGVFYVVRPISWGKGAGLTVGQADRWGSIAGRLTVEVWAPEGSGFGASLNANADVLRDAFVRLRPTTTTGMEVQIDVPSGPRPLSRPGYAGVAVTMPFHVVETITS